jgi:hypothetical protein
MPLPSRLSPPRPLLWPHCERYWQTFMWLARHLQSQAIIPTVDIITSRLQPRALMSMPRRQQQQRQLQHQLMWRRQPTLLLPATTKFNSKPLCLSLLCRRLQRGRVCQAPRISLVCCLRRVPTVALQIRHCNGMTSPMAWPLLALYSQYHLVDQIPTTTTTVTARQRQRYLPHLRQVQVQLPILIRAPNRP